MGIYFMVLFSLIFSGSDENVFLKNALHTAGVHFSFYKVKNSVKVNFNPMGAESLSITYLLLIVLSYLLLLILLPKSSILFHPISEALFSQSFSSFLLNIAAKPFA